MTDYGTVNTSNLRHVNSGFSTYPRPYFADSTSPTLPAFEYPPVPTGVSFSISRASSSSARYHPQVMAVTCDTADEIEFMVFRFTSFATSIATARIYRWDFDNNYFYEAESVAISITSSEEPLMAKKTGATTYSIYYKSILYAASQTFTVTRLDIDTSDDSTSTTTVLSETCPDAGSWTEWWVVDVLSIGDVIYFLTRRNTLSGGIPNYYGLILYSLDVSTDTPNTEATWTPSGGKIHGTLGTECSHLANNAGTIAYASVFITHSVVDTTLTSSLYICFNGTETLIDTLDTVDGENGYQWETILKVYQYNQDQFLFISYNECRDYFSALEADHHQRVVIEPDGTVTSTVPATTHDYALEPIASFLDTTTNVAIVFSGTNPTSRTFYEVDLSTGETGDELSIPRVGQIRAIFPRLNSDGNVLMLAEYTGNSYGGAYLMAIDPSTWTIAKVYTEWYATAYAAWNFGELFIMQTASTTVSVFYLIESVITPGNELCLIVEQN